MYMLHAHGQSTVSMHYFLISILGLTGCEHLGVSEAADIGLLWNTEGV